jgi:hypothetical protein
VWKCCPVVLGWLLQFSELSRAIFLSKNSIYPWIVLWSNVRYNSESWRRPKPHWVLRAPARFHQS